MEYAVIDSNLCHEIYLSLLADTSQESRIMYGVRIWEWGKNHYVFITHSAFNF